MAQKISVYKYLPNQINKYIMRIKVFEEFENKVT